MIKRIGFFAYGVVCYAIFFATFLYAVGFIGGFVVPTTLDGPARVPLAQGIAVNAALLGIFAVQHSVMARRWFKERWTRIVPPALERSTYVLMSSLALILVFWKWEPLGGEVWSVQDPIGRAVLQGLFGMGFLLVLVATFLINHFDLFGLRQVWLYLRNKPYTKLNFGTPLFYRYVRHPLYVGWFFAFWATPTMTYAHLLFAVATTAYILIAIQFEERDLVHEHGESYENYRRQVPMLIPFARTAPRTTLQKAGTAALAFFLIKGLVWLGIGALALWW
ncbi:MAG TPA: isoprenylcysteine carboxylmethyltransferase family protein [Thermoanaerobaculia bacterium]|nr:isoprenylcysteine carboxylmethyltransferase family protein [Thermoanaerobaculia bacterium]